MRVYQLFEVDEETPVQYCAVHPVRWRPEWGEPTALFREVDDRQQALFDAAPILADALAVLLAAGETGLMSDWYPAREQARTALRLLEPA